MKTTVGVLLLLIHYTTVLAATGDSIYIKKVLPTQDLLPEQRVLLGNAATWTFPTIDTANMLKMRCWQGVSGTDGDALWKCWVKESVTVTSAELLDMEIDNELVNTLVTPNGSDWDVIRTVETDDLSAGALYRQDLFTEGAFSLDLTETFAYVCWRPDPAVATNVDCQHYRFSTDVPANWADDRKAGLVFKTLGKVP